MFLGVPVTGSYSILSLLGRDRIIKTIALIDIYNSKKTLLQVFSKFPGNDTVDAFFMINE
ncbi:MAG: hypothetical protein IPH96_17895 [Saprospiraceae bacterium]|nr:hypothetical protein [Saprospiraceae bacterium]